MSSRQDVSALASWLWEASCVIRGPVGAHKLKDHILPLVFLDRLSDVFDDEIDHLAHEFGARQMAATLVDQDHQLVRFYIPANGCWSTIAAITTSLGQTLTDAVPAIARDNLRLSGVIDVADFDATTAGQHIVDDGGLAAVVQVLNRPFYRFCLDNVETDILSRADEYLLWKFAEAQPQNAGEFYTPQEVAMVMARILDPRPGMSVCDPCSSSGGVFVQSRKFIGAHSGRLGDVSIYGQDSNYTTWRLVKMNLIILDIRLQIAHGDSLHNNRYPDKADYVLANPSFNVSDWRGELLHEDQAQNCLCAPESQMWR
jgi:type I restriction enzyme M protein